MSDLLTRVDELLASLAVEANPQQRDTIDTARQRLTEPLRVAIAGRIKAGKSTLLNAIIGTGLAGTDAAECTRHVTWYMNGVLPKAIAVHRNGESTQVRLTTGENPGIDLGSVDESAIDHLEVVYPSPRLDAMTLIDTPGIASIAEDVSERTSTFLAPASRDQGADVVVFLLRFLHERDTNFLEAFTDPNAHDADPVRSVAVLSRSDEIGAGRGDGLDVARSIAARYRNNRVLRRHVSDVIAVSGLLALTGSTLTQREYDDLRRLADLPLRDQERLLLSAARFMGASDHSVANIDRDRLMARLGVPGVSLAMGALRGDLVGSATELAGYLDQLSGIGPLRRLLIERYTTRADTFKAARAFDLARELVADGGFDPRLNAAIERIESNSHELAELRGLARLPAAELTPRDHRRIERALGGFGDPLAIRVDLPESTPLTEVIQAAYNTIDELRSKATLVGRDQEALYADAVRSLESRAWTEQQQLDH